MSSLVKKSSFTPVLMRLGSSIIVPRWNPHAGIELRRAPLRFDPISELHQWLSNP
jgi:hypothetical protein